mmetsp:Transcript_78980/g.223522  ORF Transcript_78980/g.223522 Transcript_78980/m.223522 type:complete len:207 (-) Transcript_78980:328-948(-)
MEVYSTSLKPQPELYINQIGFAVNAELLEGLDGARRFAPDPQMLVEPEHDQDGWPLVNVAVLFQAARLFGLHPPQLLELVDHGGARRPALRRRRAALLNQVATEGLRQTLRLLMVKVCLFGVAQVVIELCTQPLNQCSKLAACILASQRATKQHLVSRVALECFNHARAFVQVALGITKAAMLQAQHAKLLQRNGAAPVGSCLLER